LAAVGNPGAAARIYDELAAAADDTQHALELAIAAAGTHLEASDPAGALAAARAALARPGAERVPAATLRLARELAGAPAWPLRAWDGVLAAYEPLGKAPVEISRRLGMALERTGREVDALPVYRTATLDPTARGDALAIAWRRLAELEERQGDFAAAAATLAAGATHQRTAESPAARARQPHRAAHRPPPP